MLKKNGEYLTCERCGKEFYRDKAHMKKRYFCSPECVTKSRNAKYQPGTKYAYLTIEGFVEGVKYHGWRVLKCRCCCGKEMQVPTGLWGTTKSCGCMKNKSHGMSYSNEYYSWSSMLRRCNDEDDAAYKWYGARGIKVLYKDFQEFYNDVGPRPGAGYSIDRIDVNGNYEIGNCRWATYKQQANNTRSNVRYRIGDETHTISEWSDIFGYKYNKMRDYLIKNGERIFNT